METYEVGKQIFAPGPDSVIFDVTPSGCVLIIQMARPTSQEKRSFQSMISMRYRVADDIIFILVRLGVMQWMDAPYYRGLSRDASLPDHIDDGAGLSLHAMLVDASTGILVAQKLIGLSTDGSRALVQAIQEQPEIPNYDSRLRAAFARYNTIDLLDGAVNLC